jgi:hypothetical protein
MKILLLSLVLMTTSLAVATPANSPFQVQATGKGRPVLFIPGLSSGETWDTTVAHYKDRYECHVLTVAGFVSGGLVVTLRGGRGDVAAAIGAAAQVLSL